MARRLQLRVLPAAIDDAESVIRHIGADSPANAELFRTALGETFSFLQRLPRAGASVTEHQSHFSEVRRYTPRKFRTYLVFYAIEPGRIIILRIVHGAIIRKSGSMPPSD